MGNGNPGPQGQPPQRPPSPSGEIVTFDKPDSEEEKRGCPGSLRQLKDFEIYDLIQEFRAKNPTCIVPKGSSLIFNPEIHQRNEIGYYKSSRHPFKYYMHSFHDKPVKVYYSTYTDNTNTRVMCANPLPEGFYYFSKKNYKYYPLDISNTKQRDKDLFVKNLDGEYVEFPFKVPKDLKFITSHDDVPANEV